MNDKADVCIASQLVRCPSDSGPGEWTSYTASYSAGSVARGHWSVWCRNSPGFVVFVVVCNIQCSICSGRRIDFLIVCSHCILPYCSVYGFRFTPYIVASFIEASCKKERILLSVLPTCNCLLSTIRTPFPLALDLSVRSTMASSCFGLIIAYCALWDREFHVWALYLLVLVYIPRSIFVSLIQLIS